MSYTIIEDQFSDDTNQVTGARGFTSNSHVPQDMAPPRKNNRGSRIDLPDLTPRTPAYKSNNYVNYAGPSSESNYNQFTSAYGGAGGGNIPYGGGDINRYSPYAMYGDQGQPQEPVQQQPIYLPPTPEGLSCRDVFSHVSGCPLCESYFRRDIKMYWVIIVILVLVILLMSRGK
jgi:hypothetical protein